MFKRHTGLYVLCLMLIASVFVLGCEGMGEHTKRGAVGGGVAGAVVGGVIGHQMGRGIEGAAIGATLGALGGGAIGSSIDARSKEQILASNEKLGISDVIVLSKSGMVDDAIIDKIARTGSVYTLSVEEIEALRKEGVSTRVVNYMISTSGR